MASDYTEGLGIELIGSGDKAGSWGDVTNNNLQALEEGISRYAEIAIADTAASDLDIPDNTPAYSLDSKGRSSVIKWIGTVTAGTHTVTLKVGGINRTQAKFIAINGLNSPGVLLISCGVGTTVSVPNGYSADIHIRIDAAGTALGVVNSLSSLSIDKLALGNQEVISNTVDDRIDIVSSTLQIGDGVGTAVIQSDGTGATNRDLVIRTSTAAAPNDSGSIRLNDTPNGNIQIIPGGEGAVAIPKVDIDGGTINATVIGGASRSSAAFTTLGANDTSTLATVNASGNITTSANIGGQVITAATGLRATTGGLIVSSGSTNLTGGGITSAGNIAGAGSIGATSLTATTGNLTTNSGDIQATAGNLGVGVAASSTGTGKISAVGLITTSGNIETTGSGTISSAGRITSGNGLDAGGTITGATSINSGLITVQSGGITLNAGVLNVGNRNITNAGAISGVTTVNASGGAVSFGNNISTTGSATITSGGRMISGSGLTTGGSITSATSIAASGIITSGGLTLNAGTLNVGDRNIANAGAISGVSTINTTGDPVSFGGSISGGSSINSAGRMISSGGITAGGTITGATDIGASGTVSTVDLDASGTITGNFEGSLQGDVIGDLEGDVTGNVSGSSGTVTQASQPAITSVGTLTNLNVDNVNVNGRTVGSSSGNLNITPATGSSVVIDTETTIDGGVVTSPSFIGALEGDVTGNVSGSSGSTTGNADTVTNGVYTTNNLSVMEPTTANQLRTLITEDTGTGNLVFADGPTLTAPALGTIASGDGSALTGTATNLTAGNVTNNADLTGPITSSGNATAISSNVIINANINGSAGIAYTKMAAANTAPTWNQDTTGQAATVATNADLTGPVTSSGNATTIAAGAVDGLQLDTATAPIQGYVLTATDASGGLDWDLSTVGDITRVNGGDGISTPDPEGPVVTLNIDAAQPTITSAINLTSIGTLTNLTVTNPIAGSVTGSAGSAATAGSAISATTATTAGKITSITNTDIVQLDATQTLTNKTLTEPTLTAPDLGTPSAIDLSNASNPPTWNQDTTGNAGTATKIASINNNDIVQLDAVQTLDNKTLTNVSLTTPDLGTPSAINLANASNPPTWNQSTTGNAGTATRIASIANSNIVQLASTQDLTNKTLTSPILTNPNLGIPSAINLANASNPPTWNQDTDGNALTATTATNISGINKANIVQTTSTQTLTNKTIDAATLSGVTSVTAGSYIESGLFFSPSGQNLTLAASVNNNLTLQATGSGVTKITSGSTAAGAILLDATDGGVQIDVGDQADFIGLRVPTGAGSPQYQMLITQTGAYLHPNGGRYLNLNTTTGTAGFGLRGTSNTFNVKNNASDDWGQPYHANMTSGQGAFFETTGNSVLANADGGPLPHLLGTPPRLITVKALCKVAQFGYTQGDTVYLFSGGGFNNRGISISADATNIRWSIGAGGIQIIERDLTGTNGEQILASNTNWELQIMAWK